MVDISRLLGEGMPRTIKPTPHEPSASAIQPLRQRSRRSRGRAALVIVAALTTAALVGGTAPAVAHDRGRGHHDDDNAFRQVNLVSDLDTFGPNVLVDPDLKNPWGIDFGPTTPLWVSNQFTDKVTLYSGANGTTARASKVPLRIDANDPTGM